MIYFLVISVNTAFFKALTKGSIKGMVTDVFEDMGGLRPEETRVVGERRRRRRVN